ncbi:MAG: efflux RND transporter periplasmic adaptor subunit, partial [Proteobacteria bacterium]|nr:efflux RND transporter periplasmic adaptor subunit [Pseudomonadota bacterium]
TIKTGVVEGALLVPQQAVFFDQDAPFVYVIGVDGAERRPVRIGRRGPNRVEITHGLVPGDRVSVVVPAAGAG